MSSSGGCRLPVKVVPVSAGSLLAAVQTVSYCCGSQGICGCGNWMSDMRMKDQHTSHSCYQSRQFAVSFTASYPEHGVCIHNGWMGFFCCCLVGVFFKSNIYCSI